MTTRRNAHRTKPKQPQQQDSMEDYPLSELVNHEQPVEEQPKTELLAADKTGKKWKNMGIRTFTTLLMVAAFLFVLASGYIWSIVGVMGISVGVYREVIQLAQVPAKEKSVRWFKTMSW